MSTYFVSFRFAFKKIVLCALSLLFGCTSQNIKPETDYTHQNTAKIYITRPSTFFLSAITAPIYINNRYTQYR